MPTTTTGITLGGRLGTTHSCVEPGCVSVSARAHVKPHGHRLAPKLEASRVVPVPLITTALSIRNGIALKPRVPFGGRELGFAMDSSPSATANSWVAPVLFARLSLAA